MADHAGSANPAWRLSPNDGLRLDPTRTIPRASEARRVVALASWRGTRMDQGTAGRSAPVAVDVTHTSRDQRNAQFNRLGRIAASPIAVAPRAQRFTARATPSNFHHEVAMRPAKVS